ncbi:MAG: sensor histidine kinase [Methylophilaceae bacterium]|nr:sensor histidine kinase [Methylophilaceae bacterium]
MIKPYSIRRQLLKWLLIPMLALLILDSSLLFHFANKVERETFDHGLLQTANDIDEFLERFNAQKLVPLDQNTQKALLADASDQGFYSVKDEFGQTLIGEPGIQYRKKLQGSFAKSNTVYYFSEINHQRVRIISMPATIGAPGKHLNVYIQVAETLNKRTHIRQQILAWILLPQLILFVAAGVLLWIGIKSGLKPLWEVNDALAKRSYTDLQPIKISNIPIEITRLVDSVNELMAKLNQTIHSQNRFLADAAHQLRTPLAGTRAQIELANQSKSLPDIKNRLQKISLSTERLIHLINQLLILAKSQPEAIHQLDFEPIDLAGFVKLVACEFNLNASAKKITLSCISEDRKCLVSGEKLGLHNLIYNLIDNAIRYTPYGGSVTLNVFMQNGGVCFTVEDNGLGIPKSEQGLVFERFYRGNEATDFGTGLGLAIVKEITALHHATITIESGDKDKEGTKISVFFKE